MGEEGGVEEQGKTRETGREGSEPRAKSSFTPSRRLLDDHQRTLREKNLTLAVLVVGMLVVLWSVLSVHGQAHVFVMDPAGGTTQGPLEPLATSKGYFVLTSINATQAALQRSSIGFDLEEMLSVYFRPKARQKLEDDLSRRIEDMRRRQLTTKPIIDGVTPPQNAGKARIVRVNGRLQTTGAVNGRVFYDEPSFEALYVYQENPDLGSKAAMPWMVDEIDLAIGEGEIAKQRARNRLK